MTRATVLHYLTQWMWLSDSFVFGPIAVSQHQPVAVSRMAIVNKHVYPPPPKIFALGNDAPPEGRKTAEFLAAKLNDLRPDLVHVHHGYSLPDAVAVADAFQVPLVASFWGYDVTALPTRDPSRVEAYIGRPDAVVVPSQFLAERVLALGVNRERIDVIPGSVDSRFFEPTSLPSKPHVAFIGRFVAKKGIDTLLQAWTPVRQAVPDAELTLLGYGGSAPQSDATKGVRVDSPNLIDPRGQVHDLIRWCRLYVSPSRTGPDGDSESQHIGNLEAQAAGRVVLTTDHGPIPEFVADDINGVVVAEGDHVALANALIELLHDQQRCERLASEATRAARPFDVAQVGKVHDALYRRLLNSPTTHLKL